MRISVTPARVSPESLDAVILAASAKMPRKSNSFLAKIGSIALRFMNTALHEVSAGDRAVQYRALLRGPRNLGRDLAGFAGAEKTFLQGIIQIAAAFHHYQRGQFARTRSLLEAGLGRLDASPATIARIALEPLAAREGLGSALGQQGRVRAKRAFRKSCGATARNGCGVKRHAQNSFGRKRGLPAIAARYAGSASSTGSSTRRRFRSTQTFPAAATIAVIHAV